MSAPGGRSQQLSGPGGRSQQLSGPGGRFMGSVCRRFLGAAAAITVGMVVTFAPPAGASDAPSIAIDSPSSGSVLDGASASVSGTVTMHATLGLKTNRLTGVTLQLTSPVHPGPLPECGDCWEGEFAGSFSWATPELAWNGPYTAVVTAAGRENPVDFNGDETASATRGFSVAVPPTAPDNVSAVVNPDRTVTVSWAPSSEPDAIGYRVQRRDPGSSSFLEPGAFVAHPEASLVDPAPAQGGGGAFAYRVQAIRPGSSGTSDTAMGSAFSDVGVEVPGPAGGPPIGPGGGPPIGPGGGLGAGDGGGGAPPAGAPVNLAGFVGGGSPPRASLPGLAGLSALPDGSFDSTLPYGPGVKGGGSAAGSRSAALVPVGAGANRRSLMVPVAAGLLLGVTAVHLRLFGRRVALEAPDGG